MLAPLLDQDLGFGKAVEHLAPKQLGTQLAVKALDVAVFPRAAWLDRGCLAPTPLIQSFTAVATNSGPLSERINSGTSRRLSAASNRVYSPMSPTICMEERRSRCSATLSGSDKL